MILPDWRTLFPAAIAPAINFVPLGAISSFAEKSNTIPFPLSRSSITKGRGSRLRKALCPIGSSSRSRREFFTLSSLAIFSGPLVVLR
ncbi:hypothetical protein YC2023_116511 [Brassica napus]